MVNCRRGEIAAEFDGQSYTLCLTLGALAELETAFGDEDMLALATRFERGRLSAVDLQKILAAGLKGGGHDVSVEEVAQMRAEGGAAGFVDVVGRLLSVTFGGAEDAVGRAPEGADVASTEDGSARPFPGTT
ncbi:MAG: gene transfer agent family protein [Pseudomonadota bacterium]